MEAYDWIFLPLGTVGKVSKVYAGRVRARRNMVQIIHYVRFTIYSDRCISRGHNDLQGRNCVVADNSHCGIVSFYASAFNSFFFLQYFEGILLIQIIHENLPVSGYP